MINHLLYKQAKSFVIECYKELNRESEIQSRMHEIQKQIEQSGIYEHTFDELIHGSRMAWRNSNRVLVGCFGIA